MIDNTECCGWASWGELAGMGDGRARVSAWESPAAERESAAGARNGAAKAGRWHSGHRAQKRLAMLRWRLGERNKQG